MAGRRGRGSRPSTSMEEQLAKPIDLNKRRSFQYVPANVGRSKAQSSSGGVSPQASKASPQFASSFGRVGSLSPTLSHTSTAQAHAGGGSAGLSPSTSSSSSFFARLGRRTTSSSAVATRKEQRRKQRKKRKKRKHINGSATSVSTLGDYSDSEVDMGDFYDSFCDDDDDGDDDHDEGDAAMLGDTSTSGASVNREGRSRGGRRRRRLRCGLSYARKLQQWQREASHTYSSRHHVRFQRRLELPNTNISPDAVALLERSIFAHRNHPIIENMQVHPMPPLAVDSSGVGWNDAAPPTMVPSASSSTSAMGWVSAVSSQSSTRGNSGMVQSITFRQLSEPPSHHQQQQSQTGTAQGLDDESAEKGAEQARETATSTEGEETTAQQHQHQQHQQPPRHPISAWGEALPPQSRSVRKQRSAHEVFSQLESSQGHNEDADTSVFVVDYRLSVLDRLRLLPSQMPAQLEETRVTDVPCVEAGMTFFRKSALQYVFGDLADDPGQRDDSDFAFDVDAVRAVFDQDLAATSKPIGHAPLESVTEDVAMEEPAAVLRRSARRSNAFDLQGESSRPFSVTEGDDHRLSVASVYGFADMGESTDVDGNQQALPRGNSISIPGLQGTAETDEPLARSETQQEAHEEESASSNEGSKQNTDANSNAKESEEMPASPGSDHSESGFGFGFDELIDNLFFNKEKATSSPPPARAALAQWPRSTRLSRRLSSEASGRGSPATSPRSGKDGKEGRKNDGAQERAGREEATAGGSSEEQEEQGETPDPARGYMSVFPEEGDDESSDDELRVEAGDSNAASGDVEVSPNAATGAETEGRGFKRRDTDVVLGYGFTAPSKLDAIEDAEEYAEDAAGEVTAGPGALLGNGKINDDNGDEGDGDDGDGVLSNRRGRSIMRVTRNENHEAEMARLRESARRGDSSGQGRVAKTGGEDAGAAWTVHENDQRRNEDEAPLPKEQEELMAKTVEELGDADDQYEQLHYLKQLQELLRGDKRQIRECIDCAGVVVLHELVKQEGFVAVQEAALDAMALIADQRIGCLELSDSGCLTTLAFLLRSLSIAESAARVVVAIANHMLDLVVLTGTLPKFVVVMPRFDKPLLKESIAMLHACRANHAAGLARSVPMDPLLTALQDLRTSEDEGAAVQMMDILHTIRQQQPRSAPESLTSALAQQALSPFKDSINERARTLATELLLAS